MDDDLTIDDVMAEFYFREQVDKGLDQLDEDQGIDHDEVKKRHEKWLKN